MVKADQNSGGLGKGVLIVGCWAASASKASGCEAEGEAIATELEVAFAWRMFERKWWADDL